VGAQQRDLGGHPAAEGVADDADAGQVQGLEQLDVGGREGGGAVHRRRAVGPAEPGVGGGDDPSVRGELGGEPGDGHRAAAAVQEQVRVAVSGVGPGDVHADPRQAC